MAKVTLTDLTTLANDTSAVNSLNTNFQTLEDYINNNVLSRDTGAETNTMQNDIDMNSNSLTNVANLNGEPIADILTGATTSATAAAASAAAASTSETNASTSETNAASSASAAATSASNAATSETNAATSETNAAASAASVGDIVAYVAASSGTSFTPDMANYANFHFTLTGNVSMVNPSTESVGRSGVFVFIQDGTGSRTITSWGTDYEFAGGTAPTLTTTASAVDLIPYYVYASGRILVGNALLEFS